MKINSCWIKILFSSNPESFQILADAIVNISITLLRRGWKYKRGDHNPHIKEQTTQWEKKNVQKEKQRSTKDIYKAKGRVIRVPLRTGLNSSTPDGYVDSAPLVEPVVLI